MRTESQLVTRHPEPVCEAVDSLFVKVSWSHQLSERCCWSGPLKSCCDEASAIQSLPVRLRQSSLLSSCEVRGFLSFGASLLDTLTCFSWPKCFV